MLFRITKQALEETNIIEWLRELRGHAHIDYSGFAVASIIHFQDGDKHVYIGGVNAEHPAHNILGAHAETNAIAAMVALHGPEARVSDVWVMGAPNTIKAGSDDALANNFISPCGRCRQTLIGFATPDAKVSSVTVNGETKLLGLLSDLLPDVFSERDLPVPNDEHDPSVATSASSASPGMFARKVEMTGLLGDSKVSQEKMLAYFQQSRPRILDSHFKTSPVTAVVLELENGRYIPGVLVQNIAFLSIDPISACLGIAITLYGAEAIRIERLHVYTKHNDFTDGLISSSDIQLLHSFADSNFTVTAYNDTGETKSMTLAECYQAQTLRFNSAGAKKSAV